MINHKSFLFYQQPKQPNSKGFTLIELLVVIGIVAILSAVVILTLNPAELLRQSRDSNRLSDLSTIKNAVALYLADVSGPSVTDNSNTCYVSVNNTSTVNVAGCGGRFAITGGPTDPATSTKSGGLSVGGNGWVPVNFSLMSTGAPIGNLPKDPTNSITHYYAYKAVSTSTVFEVNAKMESGRYQSGGPSDVEGTDGGNNSAVYEVGTDPGLDL